MKLNQLEKFAEAALTGVLASSHFTTALTEGEKSALARECFEIAECMMEEARKREKPFDQQSENDE